MLHIYNIWYCIYKYYKVLKDLNNKYNYVPSLTCIFLVHYLHLRKKAWCLFDMFGVCVPGEQVLKTLASTMEGERERYSTRNIIKSNTIKAGWIKHVDLKYQITWSPVWLCPSSHSNFIFQFCSSEGLNKNVSNSRNAGVACFHLFVKRAHFGRGTLFFD